MVNDAGVRAAEIGHEPDVDARDRQLAVFDPGTTGAVDELPGPFVEQCVGVFGSKRHGLQVRTADRSAIDAVMDPGVLPDRAQNPMLYVVQT